MFNKTTREEFESAAEAIRKKRDELKYLPLNEGLSIWQFLC